VLALVLVGSAAAATIRGTARSDRISADNGRRDTITCGRSVDTVVADAVDRVAADCEIVSRRISIDPYRTDAAQHASAVEPAVAAFGNTVVATFQVGRFNDGAASNIGFAVSRNAGRTWTAGGLLPSLTARSRPAGPWPRASDPSVAYDPVHGVWLITSLTVGTSSSGIVVSRSTDGLHWTAPVTVTVGGRAAGGGDIALDKEWIACDTWTTSTHRGRCYVAYTDVFENRIAEQWSDDGGLTWSAKVPVLSSSGNVGAIPLVGRDGTVVVIVADIPDRGPSSILAARSFDGGSTFSPRTVVSDVQFTNVPGFRAIPLPSAVVDASGRFVVVWQDCRFRGCGPNDVALTTSTDGATWSTPRRVPTEPASSAVHDFMPGIGADPTRPGRLAVVYSRTSARCDDCLTTGFVSTSDGGTTWTQPKRLDARRASNGWLARSGPVAMIGDYLQTAFAGGRAVPVFVVATPKRNGVLDQAVAATSLPVR
jgi:hypothetical protein